MKVVKTFFLSIVLIAAALGLLIFFFLSGAAKRGIELAGTNALGTKVSMAGFDLSLRDKQATMNGLEIANPPGFSAADIVAAKNVSVKIGDITKKLLVIDDITVDGLVVNYELGTAGSNFDALRKAMPSSSAPASAKDGAARGSGTTPDIVIHRIKITDAKVIPAIGKNAAPVSLPEITLTDIGTADKPASAREISLKIMNRLMSASTTAVATSGITNSIGKSVDKTIEKTTEKLHGLFGK